MVTPAADKATRSRIERAIDGVSVVVPTYNRPRFAGWAVRSLLEQTQPPDEIIVVENGSSTETAAVLRDLEPAGVEVRYVIEPRLGVSHVRNRGAAEARGELLAFLDDDSVASCGWLAALLDAWRSTSNAVAVGGQIMLRWPCARPRWLTTELEGYYGTFDLGPSRTELRYPTYPYASNLAITHSAFDAVGGFPTALGRRGKSLISNEEDGIFRRVAERGWQVVYEPHALVHHWVHTDRLSRRWLLHRSFAQGRSDVLVDMIFAERRARLERVRRAVDALSGAGSAAGIAAQVLVARDRSPFGPLNRVSSELGSSFEELRLALSPQAVEP